MSSVQSIPPQEYLQGSVERITFYNEDNGFCILRAEVKGHRDLITILGNVAAIYIGEYIECKGHWLLDSQYGLQFKAQQLKVIPPKTLKGIEKYLGSGLIKGIGPHFAKKLIHTFGEDVLEIIGSEPHRLLLVDGIGRKRQQQIITSWEDQKAIRHLMIFLQSHQLGTAKSVRIHKTYGDQAIEKIQKNPYCLATDIQGIGFKTADALAEKLGIPTDSIVRARAGIRHVLQQYCDKGHCAVEQNDLLTTSHQLLSIPTTTLEQAIGEEIHEKFLIQEIIDDQPCIYPITLYHAEKKSAEYLLQLNKGNLPWKLLDIDQAIIQAGKKTNLILSPSQCEAIHCMLTSKLAIVTGGPGVGKTTLVNSFVKIIQSQKLSIALCAPTGRAAKRLTETTGVAAKTIHRLLEFEPRTSRFKYNQHHPLPIDVLIIDESSMLDIVLLYHLLKAIPSHAAVIFVGDIDQLPSVGSGAVLSDLIDSTIFPVIRLTTIFRQASNSKIITNAHRVNQGLLPLANQGKQSDFFTIYAKTPEEIQQQLVELVCARLPAFYHCDPIKDIQILTPMHRGGLGSRGLNLILQQALNAKAEPKITRFGTTFAPGDKVIQITNNYDKETFNGDIGFIQQIDLIKNTVGIFFDRLVHYDIHELDELNLAYAISIHKSQGSEFPIVVMPISTQHYMLLARKLLYTGLTRGKKLVVLIAQKEAIGMAVRNHQIKKRLTNLAKRLINLKRNA